jgi:tetratricopeptide (TPR) repeat protein
MRFWILAALLCWIGISHADVKINLNVKEGEVIKKVFKVEATVQSDKLVEKVEFIVNDRLREVARSTPYTFEWDTIADAEGEHTLEVVATTEGGATKNVKLKIKVDNEVALGAEHHYEQARELFAEGKTEEAIYVARIALKARSEFKEARILLIQALLKLNRFEAADNVVEDLVRAFPDTPEGYRFRAAAALRRARGSADEIKLIGTAIENQRKVLQFQIKDAENAGTSTEALVRQADLAMQNGEFDKATDLFFSCSQREENNILYRNRLAQAHLKAGRYQDALVVTGAAIRRNIADAYTYTVLGLTYMLQGKSRESEAAFTKAEQLKANYPPLLITQAYLAMIDGKSSQAARLLGRVQAEGYSSPEVSFMLAWIWTNSREFDRARDQFWRTLEMNPLFAEIYTLRGMENLMDGLNPRKSDLIPIGREWLGTAIKAQPTFAPALMTHALSYLVEAYVAKRDGEEVDPSNKEEALRLYEQHIKKTREAAWVYVCSAMILNQMGRGLEADKLMAKANQLDKERVDSLRVPDMPRGLRMLQQLMFPPQLPNP